MKQRIKKIIEEEKEKIKRTTDAKRKREKELEELRNNAKDNLKTVLKKFTDSSLTLKLKNVTKKSNNLDEFEIEINGKNGIEIITAECSYQIIKGHPVIKDNKGYSILTDSMGDCPDCTNIKEIETAIEELIRIKSYLFIDKEDL